ncbi:MAG TPA: hypothetical protein PLJ00_15735 [Chitinophagales bacterium]|nr:hypothetical protein [Chitinophagales bacterium]
MQMITLIVVAIILIGSKISDKQAENFTGMKHKTEYWYEQDIDIDVMKKK